MELEAFPPISIVVFALVQVVVLREAAAVAFHYFYEAKFSEYHNTWRQLAD